MCAAWSHHAPKDGALSSIMCIEDNPAIRDMLQLALCEIGRLQTCLCADGKEALDQLESNAPDLILLDWSLQGLSGSETLQCLQQRNADRPTPILIMATKCTAQFDQMVKNSGACGTLIKPIDPMRLAAQLRQLYDSKPGPWLN